MCGTKTPVHGCPREDLFLLKSILNSCLLFERRAAQLPSWMEWSPGTHAIGEMFPLNCQGRKNLVSGAQTGRYSFGFQRKMLLEHLGLLICHPGPQNNLVASSLVLGWPLGLLHRHLGWPRPPGKHRETGSVPVTKQEGLGMPLGTKGALLFLGRKGSRMNPLVSTLFRTSSHPPRSLWDSRCWFGSRSAGSQSGQMHLQRTPPGGRRWAANRKWPSQGPGTRMDQEDLSACLGVWALTLQWPSVWLWWSPLTSSQLRGENTSLGFCEGQECLWNKFYLNTYYQCCPKREDSHYLGKPLDTLLQISGTWGYGLESDSETVELFCVGSE